MTLTVAALVLTNLLYLVGAVAVASLVSGLYVLRHRKPKSLESGIESFSRELRALAPEHRSGVPRRSGGSVATAGPEPAPPAVLPAVLPVDGSASPDDGDRSAPGGGSG